MFTDCCAATPPLVPENASVVGATVMRARAVTVTATCFDTAPEVAVMVAFPADIPVTAPFPSTAATFDALDVHVTVLALST